jgi:Peptidase family M28
MKIIYLLLCNFFCVNIKAQTVLIDSIITKASLQYSIATLSNDSMKGRLTGTTQAKNAAIFIANQFKNAGLKPLAGNDKYFSYYSSVFDKMPFEAINVIGALQGNRSADTIVILSAHYDHIGTRQFNTYDQSDSIFNGANDNASGVAAIIELAKYYSLLKENKYTTLFIAFSGEELGLLGSADVAATINLSFVNAVINFDMIGRPISNWTKKCMVIAQNVKPILKKLNSKIYPDKNFFIADRFPDENLFKRTDHYSFRKVKNCFSLSTTSPKDEYYHTVKDEINTIDFDFLLSTTRKIALACEIFIK